MPKADKETGTGLSVAKTGAIEVDSKLAEQLAALGGDGFEEVTADDVGLTILSILQKNSPQCDEADEAYLETAKPGLFLNNLTQESEEELNIVPIGFRKSYIEYIPRDAGGGFVGRWDPNSPKVMSATKVGYKLMTDEGNELVETAEHYVLVVPTDEAAVPYVALLPLKSTQLRHSRRWLANMASKTMYVPDEDTLKRLPMYMQRYTLRSGVEKNKKGTWYGLTDIQFNGTVDADSALFGIVIEAVKAFSDTLASTTETYEKVQGNEDAVPTSAVTKSMA
jgi:hypothetical protein